jgi:hypothetical protein
VTRRSKLSRSGFKRRFERANRVLTARRGATPVDAGVRGGWSGGGAAPPPESGASASRRRDPGLRRSVATPRRGPAGHQQGVGAGGLDKCLRGSSAARCACTAVPLANASVTAARITIERRSNSIFQERRCLLTARQERPRAVSHVPRHALISADHVADPARRPAVNVPAPTAQARCGPAGRF